VYFIRQLANHVLHVNNGKVTAYPAGYDYFLHRKAQEEGEEAELFRAEERMENAQHKKREKSNHVRPQKTQPKTEEKTGGRRKKSKEQKRREAEERNALYRQAKEQESRDKEKGKWVAEEADILAQLGNPATHQKPTQIADLTRRLGEIKKKLKSFI